MNKIALVIGVGKFQLAGLNYLKSLGMTIVGVDGAEHADGKVLCDRFYHCDLNKIPEILEIVSKEKIDFAIGFECDPAVDAINIVNSTLGLPALNEIARRASIDKLLVRQYQKKLGLNCPSFYEIFTLEQLKQTVSESKKEWVLKPMGSSGSRGVQLLNNNSDLENAFMSTIRYRSNSQEVIILEEFISGKEIAIDGFCHNGKCHVLSISHKDRTDPPYLLDKGLLISPYPKDPLAITAKKQLELLFNSLQSDLSTPFHAEFLHNATGVYLVEFSFRGAGFNVFSRLIPLVTSFDTLGFSINQILLSPEWPTPSNDISNELYLGFFEGKNGIIKSINVSPDLENDPLIDDLKIYVSSGDKTSELKSGADRIGHVVIKGPKGINFLKKFEEVKEGIIFEYE